MSLYRTVRASTNSMISFGSNNQTWNSHRISLELAWGLWQIQRRLSMYLNLLYSINGVDCCCFYTLLRSSSMFFFWDKIQNARSIPEKMILSNDFFSVLFLSAYYVIEKKQTVYFYKKRNFPFVLMFNISWLIWL